MTSRKRFFLAGAAALILAAAAVVLAESTKVFLYNYEGAPLLIRGRKPIKLGIDVELFKNDRIEIDAQSMAEITAHEFGGVRVLASSSCRIVDASKDHFHIEIEKGGFLANLKHLPPGLDFTVSTPHYSATARFAPAQFSGRIDPADVSGGGSHVAIRKGTLDVLIKESSASQRIQEDMAVDVTEDTFIPSPRSVTPEEQAALRKANTVPVLSPVKEK